VVEPVIVPEQLSVAVGEFVIVPATVIHARIMRTGSPTPGAGAVAMGVCRAIAAPLHTADQDHDV